MFVHIQNFLEGIEHWKGVITSIERVAFYSYIIKWTITFTIVPIIKHDRVTNHLESIMLRVFLRVFERPSALLSGFCNGRPSGVSVSQVQPKKIKISWDTSNVNCGILQYAVHFEIQKPLTVFRSVNVTDPRQSSVLVDVTPSFTYNIYVNGLTATAEPPTPDSVPYTVPSIREYPSSGNTPYHLALNPNPLRWTSAPLLLIQQLCYRLAISVNFCVNDSRIMF